MLGPMLSKYICFMVCAAMAAQAAEKVVGGPFAVNVSGRSATVVWIVETGEAAISAQGGTESRTVPTLRAEKVVFRGLKPGTEFQYKVPGQELTGSFKTPPAEDQPFEFVVYGDNRTRAAAHKKVIEAVLANSHPDFVVQTGDMVADGADNSQWPTFFDIERELLRHTAFFPTIGNHEHNAGDYYDFFQTTPYYSFDWGNAHFVFFDSDLANAAPTQTARKAFWNEQTAWMEDDLRKSQGATFRFVVAHHPPMTAVASRQGDNAHVTALMPMWEKYHVTAGMFGHDHNYQHYLKNGVHYIIAGGGGAPLYDVDKPPAGITLKVRKTENFVRVRVEGKVAHMVAFGPDGSTIDSMDLEGEAH
jgi:acid phosphatase type 7